MKRILALFRQDIVTAFRDNLIVMILLAPLIMGGVLFAVTGSIGHLLVGHVACNGMRMI